MGLEPTASSATNFSARLLGIFCFFGSNYSGCWLHDSTFRRFVQAALCSAAFVTGSAAKVIIPSKESRPVSRAQNLGAAFAHRLGTETQELSGQELPGQRQLGRSSSSRKFFLRSEDLLPALPAKLPLSVTASPDRGGRETEIDSRILQAEQRWLRRVAFSRLWVFRRRHRTGHPL